MSAAVVTQVVTAGLTTKSVDLNSLDERRRLSPSGLRAFFKIMEAWQVRDDAAKVLLGRCY